MFSASFQASEGGFSIGIVTGNSIFILVNNCCAPFRLKTASTSSRQIPSHLISRVCQASHSAFPFPGPFTVFFPNLRVSEAAQTLQQCWVCGQGEADKAGVCSESPALCQALTFFFLSHFSSSLLSRPAGISPCAHVGSCPAQAKLLSCS